MIKNKPTVWIDGDACPKIIKEFIYKTSARLQLQIILVANSSMYIPQSSLIKLVTVKLGADVADSYIVANVKEQDIVITADIPLAALIVFKNATAINIRGEIYTEENVEERLSLRNFMKDLRDSGLESGGPAAFGAKDKERFANAFNKILNAR